MLESLRLDGKVAVVTGASRGLGRAMALALAEAGADVAAAARNKGEIEDTAHQVERLGRRAVAVPTDVTDFGQVEALMDRAAGALGRLDIVVNNSGISGVAPAAEMAPEQFAQTIAVNLIGVFHGCRAAAGRLIAQRAGKVVNVASVLAQVGLPGYSAYAASKGGIISLTRALGVEWARYNVQVNALAPGWFVTDMNAAAFDHAPTRERLLRGVPARRTGRVDEVGPLAVYLASAASDFMTGQTIFLDGGLSAA